MITMPDFSKAWEYETNFYLASHVTRLDKVLSHYELFKMVHDIPGTIVECGVFRGASLIRMASFREFFSSRFSREIIGFDSFGPFPPAATADDQVLIDQFVNTVGEESISTEQLMEALRHKGIADCITLVPGDIVETIPAYIARHPELRIALLNIDVDAYAPTVAALEHLWPLVVAGGVVALDDYGTFPGETRAVDEFFAGSGIPIRKFDFARKPSYIVKA